MKKIQRHWTRSILLFALISAPITTSFASTSGFSYNINITTIWDSGYCATLTITNNNTGSVGNWDVDVTVNGTVNSLWNANWSQSGATLVISNTNALAGGSSTSNIGFCADINNDGTSNDNESDNNNNIAVNGDVETDLTNWSATSGTISRTTSDSNSGLASVLITNRSASWHGITFNPGTLTTGNTYNVSVWVKLAAGEPDTTIILTGKRADDGDTSTTNEYTRITTATVTDYGWTELLGPYTQSGTPFQHFIIESDSSTVSYYVDDFSVVTTDSNGGSPIVTDKFVGNITTNGSVRSDFVNYWDQITPENAGKWGSVESSRDNYNWSSLDAIYNYAQQNNIPFKQHTFVWGSQSPNWISSLSASEQAAEIQEWISDFCTRYPNVDMIDVVNEAIPSHAPALYAQNAFGSDWIIESFQLARQHCSNAILILNDYNVLSWNTSDFISMATPVINAGVVDAIGIQAHGLESFSAAQLQSKLDQIAALGLPIYISEYDIQETDDQTQLAIMQAQFPVFYNHDSVVGITLWGYVDGATWRDGTGLIYSDGTHRPAMTWLMNYLDR